MEGGRGKTDKSLKEIILSPVVSITLVIRDMSKRGNRTYNLLLIKYGQRGKMQ